MTILVTGGAGYIGSFMTQRLLAEGHEVVVVDNLETGQHVPTDTRLLGFEKGNLLDAVFLENLFTKYTFDAVVHFAAYISMGESMEDPKKYFFNNTMGVLTLLDHMQRHGVDKLIFSSTAGVYGNPHSIPIPEDHEKNPTNPYGESKLMSERLLYWYSIVHKIDSVSLRYFNACGAALDGSMGETHIPETHLIPNVISAVLEDKECTLFGDDYDTPDGTCVRDYIHVLDLVDAHVLALKKLAKDKGSFVYNVGTGKGYSNKEVIGMIEKVTGKSVKVKQEPRRKGDAGTLVADATSIANDLGFRPTYSDLTTIIDSAWKWHSKDKVKK